MKKRNFQHVLVKSHACVSGGMLENKKELTLSTEIVENMQFVKIAKKTAWLCLVAVGTTFSRSRMKDSELFDKLRVQVAKARVAADHKAARSEDHMLALTDTMRKTQQGKSSSSALAGKSKNGQRSQTPKPMSL